MKKAIFAALFALVLAGLAAQDFMSIDSGEYACYIDERGGVAYYRTYITFRFDAEFYVFMRSTELSSGRILNLVCKMAIGDDGGLRITDVTGLPKERDSGMIQIIPDFMNFSLLYQKLPVDGNFRYQVEDPWDTFVQIVTMDRLLPIFGIAGVRIKGEAADRYRIDRAGFVNAQDEIEGVLALRPREIRENKRDVALPTLGKGEPMTVQMKGVAVKLDSSWTPFEEDQLSGYCVKETSTRDSQISVEIFPEELAKRLGLDPDKLSRRTIQTNGDSIDFTSIKARRENGYLHVYYELFLETGIRNVMYFKIKDIQDGIRLVNFSSHFDIFEKNREYYESVIEGVDL